MVEVRAFINDIEPAREKLIELGADDKGKYTIIDTIYRSADPTVSLIDEFLRLREIPENIWPEKEVILALKQTNLQNIGKISAIPLK
jgi:adenylate cyclase class IV